VHRARAHQKTHTTWAWQDLGDQEHHSAGHPEKPPPVANALASLITNHLLMFGLCCAYGTIMFDDVNAKHCALGVKISLCTAMVVGVLLAWKCGVCVAIGGPDLNPAVFLGSFVATIAEDIATQFGLECPDKYRRLGSGCGKEVKFARRKFGGPPGPMRLVSRRAPSSRCLHCPRVVGRSWPHVFFHFRGAAPHKNSQAMFQLV